MSARRGQLALVLHGHLPFVRHPEHDRFLEEDWLFEAITECYLPLLDTLHRLTDEQIPWRLTLGLSPTLLSMLTDDLLLKRYQRHLDELQDLCAREIVRTRLDEGRSALSLMYQNRFRRADRLFHELCHGDIPGAFAALAETAQLELITCAATHALLPLLQAHPGNIRAQIRTATDVHRSILGTAPTGIWLPECAYHVGLENQLADEGLKFFLLESHGLLLAQPRPVGGLYEPILCPNGVAVFGRDPDSSRQVWSSVEGYPGDPEYREFHRDIGHELAIDYIRPYVQPNGERKNLGIKYYRITGPAEDKSLYRPDLADKKTQEHARDFVSSLCQRFSALPDEGLTGPPLVVAPYDAELFGHWWFEGPRFLEFVFREMAHHTKSIGPITPGQFLCSGHELAVAQPAGSSWGQGGYNQVWLDRSNDWIYSHLHRASELMNELANLELVRGSHKHRALDQAARELMLAQASDWPFMLRSGQASEYAQSRFLGHMDNFNCLAQAVRTGQVPESRLRKMEQGHNLFPNLDYRVFRTRDGSGT